MHHQRINIFLAFTIVIMLFAQCRFDVDEPEVRHESIYESVVYRDFTSGLWFLTSADTASAAVIAPDDGSSYDGVIFVPASIIVNGIEYYVTSVDDNAFASSTISSITLSSNITSIGENAFANCDDLNVVKINSSSVISIASTAFARGFTITVPHKLVDEYARAYRQWRFTDGSSGEDAVTFFDSASKLWYSGRISLQTAVVIPIPDSVATSSEPYWGDIEIPEEVENDSIIYKIVGIDDYAFAKTKVINLITPATLSSIGDYAISECEDLTTVKLKYGGVAILSNSAFDRGTTITVPATFVSDYSAKYASCGWIFTDGREVPDFVLSTQEEMDSLCTAMAESQISSELSMLTGYVEAEYQDGTMVSFVVDEAAHTAKVVRTACGERDFALPASLIYNNEKYLVVEVDGMSELITGVALPSTLRTIGANAFRACRNLKAVVIPENVTFIGAAAFELCENLKAVQLTSKITSISDYAFSRSGLLEIDIPSNVTSIGEMAFYSCKSLTAITIGANVEYIGNYAFKDCTSLQLVNFFATNCTKMGYGEGFRYAVFEGCTALTDVICDNHPRIIPQGAFARCSALTKIQMGKNVASVGAYAFEDCERLTAIDMSMVKNLGAYAFRNCQRLKTVSLGDALNVISEYSFYNCTALKTITIPKNVEKIEQHAFGDCSALSTLNFNATNCKSMISDYEMQPAFSNCTALANLFVGDNVEALPPYAFYDCRALQFVTMGSSLKTIGYEALYRCPEMRELHMRSAQPPIFVATDYSQDEAMYYTLGGICVTCFLYVPKGSTEAYMTWKDYFPRAYIEE